MWKIIPSLPRVLASNRGKLLVIPWVGASSRGKGLQQYGGITTRGQWDGSRYIYVLDGKTHKVARLVCEAFHGPPPFERAVCMHLDENSRNNRPENLKWGTQKENLNAPGFLDYCRSRVGENSPTTKARLKRAA